MAAIACALEHTAAGGAYDAEVVEAAARVRERRAAARRATTAARIRKHGAVPGRGRGAAHADRRGRRRGLRSGALLDRPTRGAARHADSPHAYHLLHAAARAGLALAWGANHVNAQARAHVGVLLVRTAAHHIADMRAREELSMEVLGALQELAAHGFHASSVVAHARSVAAHAALRAI